MTTRSTAARSAAPPAMTTRSTAARSAAPPARSRAGRATGHDLGSPKGKKPAVDLRSGGRKKAASPKGKKPAVDLRSGGIQKRKKAARSKGKKPAATASKGKGRKRNLSEATHILKLKKEAFEARDLLDVQTVPGALKLWIKAKEDKDKAEAEAEEAQPKKKKKMVLKTQVPSALIDYMKMYPFRSIEELTPDQLAKRTEPSRALYEVWTYVDSKMRDYEDALIQQHDTLGEAFDETEVTDDDDQ